MFELTLIGSIWIILAVVILFLPIQYAALMIIVGSFFHATSVIDVAGKGVSLFAVAELFFVIRALYTRKNNIGMPRFFVVLLLLFCYALYSVIFFPYIFSGVVVYAPVEGIDSNFVYGGEPLGRTLSQWYQLGFFLLNILVIAGIYAVGVSVPFDRMFNAFIVMIVFVALMGVWGFVSTSFGIWFPGDLIYNNKGYSQVYLSAEKGVDRLNSLFTEPSFAGGVLASGFWMLFSLRMWWFALVVLLALVLAMSGVGFVAFLVGFVYIIFLRDLKAFAILFAFLLLFFLFVYIFDWWDIIGDVIIDKPSSPSGEHRFGSDLYTINLLPETLGLGVGLGSHRSSSFLSALVGNLGIPGLFLYLLFFLSFVKSMFRSSVPSEKKYAIILFVFVMLAAQITGMPDFNFPVFWSMIFIGVSALSNVSSLEFSPIHV